MSLEDQGAAGAAEQQTGNAGASAAPDPVAGKPADQGGKPEGGGRPVSPPPDARSLGEGGGKPDDAAGKPAPEARWREDWRETMAGGDERFLAHLRRYSSPENYAKAGFAAQQRIRDGAVKEPLPEKPTDEQVAAWRKDNGIPDKPEDYKIELGDGLVFGEEDKPLVASFAKFAHARNWTPEQVNQGARFVAEMQEQQRAEADQADKAYRTEAQDMLREEWGRDFRTNINVAGSLLDRYGETGLSQHLMGARGPDGRLLGDHPGFLRLLTTLGRELNPAATVVPAGVQDGGKAVAEELSGLRDMMKNDDQKFYKGDGGKHYARYQELLKVEGKLKERG